MSQQRNSVFASFLAGDTISAYQIVALTTVANTVIPWATATSVILGVAADSADSGAAANIIIGGTAKVQCGASISMGAIITAQTDTALAIEAINVAPTVTTLVVPFTLGQALQAGSTNSVIEVTVNPALLRFDF